MRKRIKAVFIKIVANFTWVSMLIISFFLVFASLIYSFHIKDFDIFASSGAIVTIAGIYLSFWPTINLTPQNETELMAHKLAFMRFWPKKGTDEYDQLLQEARQILRNERIGFGMSIIGTFIWAYGGYITI